eukprot:7806762-Ditylum_brightwellii.AAC.2
MHFDPTEPVDTIFTDIDDLADIAELAKDHITKRQKISIGYIILQCVHKFSSCPGKWNDKPNAQKTWANFQSHYHKAQTDLCRTGSLMVEDRIDHTDMINMISEGIRQALFEAPVNNENANVM